MAERKDYQWRGRPGEDVTSPERYRRLISAKLEKLRHRLDEKLVSLDEALCRDNGSTLLLGLVAYSNVWFCNIGMHPFPSPF